MTDMTVAAFCKKFCACDDGKAWAYGLTSKSSKAKMSELWEAFKLNPQPSKFEYFQWAINCNGVFSDSTLRKIACRFVRETPLAGGRKVWDLLDDERSRNAVIVAEKFADGLATKEELDAAGAAAWDSARAAAWDAAGAAWDAAWAAAWAAAWDAARDAQIKIMLEYGNPWSEETK